MWHESQLPRPWLKRYPPQIAVEPDIPDVPVTRLLDDAAERNPWNVALIFFGRRIRYRELRRDVDRFAAGLRLLGVSPGDRVALILPNCPQQVIAFYAVLRLGAVAVPTNPLLTEEELRHQLADCGARVAVVLDRAYETLRAVRGALPIGYVVVTSLVDYLPDLRRFVLGLPVRELQRRWEEITAPVPEDPGVIGFAELLESSAQNMVQAPLDPGRDLAVIQYTGGTEGRPKGAMLTHRNLVANAVQVTRWDYRIRYGRERTLAVIPMFHVFGLLMCLIRPVLIAGSVVLLPRFDPRQVTHAIRRHRPTIFPGVPPLFERVLAETRPGRRHLARLRGVSGGMALGRATAERYERAGGLLVQGYGLTEAAPSVLCNPPYGGARHVTVGMPLPLTDAVVVDEDDPRTILPPGNAGELIVRGPQVFQGYWNQPRQTAEVLARGWLRTGDIAVMSPDGYFTIIERRIDLIKVSGFSVFPSEVEEVLARHPAVVECAVIGLPEERRGEKVVACVVEHPGYPFSAEELRRHCAKYLAHYKVPEEFVPVDGLPRTILGKVLRRMVRDRFSTAL
ncbi:AMP-binding protein [Actinomadura scrupuli]|uniref:AMP-binding protein n=1 Tax=Actinomadura scrupuli TaxID=559629 RepID=UPI003D9711F1